MKRKYMLKAGLFGIFLLFNFVLYSQNADSISILFEQYDLSFKNKQYEQCRDYAEQVLQIDDLNCYAYMLLGKVYASIPSDYLDEITKENIERNMIYCLVVDMFQKAKEVDTLCTEDADKEIALYSKYYPSSHFGFNDDMVGNEYILNGWINRKTTIRYSK